MPSHQEPQGGLKGTAASYEQSHQIEILSALVIGGLAVWVIVSTLL